ncbi:MULTISPECIES: transcription antitermination factor NusB [unclassified Petrotoga]|uniref:transcription antitermination factor NusB n=1 Tax=unclassified Petrotoga TaxID=2620614 RepID=UPI00130497EB|nr:MULTISPECIES: transcription antitermination factor NusB [unclassified Petrotoga]
MKSKRTRMNENIPKKRMMRKLIFESLFQLSIKDVKLDNILFTFEKLNEKAHLEESYYLEAKQYIEDIYKNKNEYDALINKYSEGWPVERIGNIEKTVMRIFIYELINKKDIPVKVILNESTELTKTYATQKAAAFVNGIMDKIARSQASIM